MKALALLAALGLGGCVLYTGEPDPGPGGGGCDDGDCGGACDAPQPGCVPTDSWDACGDCLGEYVECDASTGEWYEVQCDPGYVVVDGTITLQQEVIEATAGCPAVMPREVLTLTVVPGEPKTLTAEAPVVVTSSTVGEGFKDVEVHAEITDDWAAPIVYDLLATQETMIYGEAIATISDSCTMRISVWGSWDTL